MSLWKKSDSLLDLLKAGESPAPPAPPSAAAPPSSPTSPGGGGSGPAPVGAEARKRGGKYIRRWWQGDHWEYEYTSTPSATAHGPANTWQKDHTMDVAENLPSHVANLADRAQQRRDQGLSPDDEDQKALERVYRHSREHGEHTKAGYSTTFKHPISGVNIQARVGVGQRGGKVVQRIRLQAYDDAGEKLPHYEEVLGFDIGSGEKKGSAKDLQEGAWKVLNQWIQAQVDVHKAVEEGVFSSPTLVGVDPSTNERVRIGRILRIEHTKGTIFDEVTGKWMDRTGKKEVPSWQIAFNKDNPIGKSYSYPIRRKDPHSLEKFSRYLEGVYSRIKRPSWSVSDLANANYSGVDMLQKGALPFGSLGSDTTKKGEYKFGNIYDSEEDRAKVRDDILQFYGEEAGNLLSDRGFDVDPSFIEKAVNRTVDFYTPIENGATVRDFFLKNVTLFAAFSQVSRKETSIESSEGGDLASQLVERGHAAVGSGYEAGQAQNKMEEVAGEAFGGGKFDKYKENYVKIQSKRLDNAESKLPNDPQYQPIKDLIGKLRDILNTEVENADVHSLAPDTKQYDAMAHIIRPMEQAAAGLNPELKNFLLLSGKEDSLFKSVQAGILKARAWASVEFEENLEKANFQYSHKEGNDIYPKYVYTDEAGNHSTRSNAPQGHPDYDSAFGDPEDDQLTLETAPQFFTADGRKLSRAPYTGVDVQWNPNYHRNDPQNLWAARWVNPVSGEHEYSYIDSDMRQNPMLKVNRQNALTDSRLPQFRQYVAALFKSEHQKDKVVAVALALLDQGRFRVRELMALRVGEVSLTRELLTIGRRKVHADPNLVQQLGTMTSNRHPGEPLFAVAPVGMEGDMDYAKMRRIGPHFIVNLLEELGMTAEALQTYHASQTYSMEIQRVFGSHNVSYDAAHTFALLEVSSEMGHNLDNVEDFETAINIIGNTAVDPIVIQAIKMNCQNMGIGGTESTLQRPVFDSVPRVSMVLAGRTEDEEEFSKWLRMVPVHNYLQQEVTNEAPSDQMYM